MIIWVLWSDQVHTCFLLGLLSSRSKYWPQQKHRHRKCEPWQDMYRHLHSSTLSTCLTVVLHPTVSMQSKKMYLFLPQSQKISWESWSRENNKLNICWVTELNTIKQSFLMSSQLIELHRDILYFWNSVALRHSWLQNKNKNIPSVRKLL